MFGLNATDLLKFVETPSSITMIRMKALRRAMPFQRSAVAAQYLVFQFDAAVNLVYDPAIRRSGENRDGRSALVTNAFELSGFRIETAGPAEGELSLSRDEAGNFTYANGDKTLTYELTDAGTYQGAGETGLTLEQLKERIAPVWDLLQPHDEIEDEAVTMAFDANVKVLGRDANRFREAEHKAEDGVYSAASTGAVWYTFDKATGICLLKETGTDEEHRNAETVYECVSFEIGK